MNIPSHYKIGKIIISIMNDTSVNKLAFLFGVIYPDINLRYISTSHIYDNNMKHFTPILDRLLYEPLKEREFAFNLGILSHYVMDYFCLHHTSKVLYKNYYEHFIHECNLHNRLKKLIASGFQKGYMKHYSLLYSICKSLSKEIDLDWDIKRIFKKRFARYTKINDVNKDIRFALLTSLIIAQSLVERRKNS